MKIGVIKEGKVPPDKRVPLSPKQCKYIKDNYEDVNIVVQKSNIRKFTDDDYRKEGIEVVDSVEDCEVLLGVKEVPLEQLIEKKKYFFFSHTFKEQPYNRDLLRAVLEKEIQLIDWEVITNAKGDRLIAFGRYAGIVGCYNGFYAYGEQSNRYHLKRAHKCEDRAEMEAQLINIDLPSNYKIVLTGKGRVGGGALEVIHKMGLKEVSPEAFLNETFSEPVYTQLGVNHYNKTSDGSAFSKAEFYEDPSDFESDFLKYARVADMYIACHYWDSRAPYIYSREACKDPNWKIKTVADISCDIDCAVASTLRPSTIADPLYGYHPVEEKEVDFNSDNAICVMAVDNLPCELPKDASVDFGEMFINHVLEPLLGNDPDDVIGRASETKNGFLTEHFSYLTDYVLGDFELNTVSDLPPNYREIYRLKETQELLAFESKLLKEESLQGLKPLEVKLKGERFLMYIDDAEHNDLEKAQPLLRLYMFLKDLELYNDSEGSYEEWCMDLTIKEPEDEKVKNYYDSLGAIYKKVEELQGHEPSCFINEYYYELNYGPISVLRDYES